jgi:hypothetical protein
MAEELQRYAVAGKKNRFKGEPLGPYERFVIGATTLGQLKAAGIIKDFATEIRFKAKVWKGKPSAASRPDEIVLDGKQTVLVVERKDSNELLTQRQEEAAAEQCLTCIQQLAARGESESAG